MINRFTDLCESKLKRVEDKMAGIVFKIFDKYDVSEIVVNDEGLKSAINLDPRLVVKTQGRYNSQKLSQIRSNIVERLMNKLATSGHRGKKHKLEKGATMGKYTKLMTIVINAFEIIEKRTEKNPVEVLVRAIENAAPRDETTVIEYGGARYPQAIDVSPVRRVNLALKYICHGASDKAFGKKKSLAQGLAEEIILAYEGNGESFALRKKNEAEKQADSAR